MFFGKIAIVATLEICGTIALLLYKNLCKLAINRQAGDRLFNISKIIPNRII
ncbi:MULTISPECIES: hypothetical protein [unclassified Microcoleus]|uniref:hypothetical protein n=1 Tax=unclassified Microcoleus TaxID=2642155 RepID=UPI002FD4E797